MARWSDRKRDVDRWRKRREEKEERERERSSCKGIKKRGASENRGNSEEPLGSTFRLLERIDGQLDIDNMREIVVKSTANGRVTDRVRTSVRGVEFELLVSILADLDSASKRLLDLVYSLNYRRAVHARTVHIS